jgi:hypothetical protein
VSKNTSGVFLGYSNFDGVYVAVLMTGKGTFIADNEGPGTVPYQIHLQMFLASLGTHGHCADEIFIFQQISLHSAPCHFFRHNGLGSTGEMCRSPPCSCVKALSRKILISRISRVSPFEVPFQIRLDGVMFKF